jgi:hypothetical protein
LKNAFRRLSTAVILLVALSFLGTSAVVNAYADVESNVTIAIPESGPGPSAPATNANRAEADLSKIPSVRIDKTGVHIGGPNPVDIDVPDLKRIQREKGFDVESIVAIVCTFGMPVAIVAIALYFKYRRNKMAHETLRMLIEKGTSITPELVASLKGKGMGDGNVRSRGPALLPGLVVAGIGAALLISDSGHSKGGWIVLFIGLAFLVVWLMERKHPSDPQPPR